LPVLSLRLTHKLQLLTSRKTGMAVISNAPISARYSLESGNEIMGDLLFDSTYPRYLLKAFDVHVLRRTYGLSVCSPLVY
jgi:hypothetical protein